MKVANCNRYSAEEKRRGEGGKLRQRKTEERNAEQVAKERRRERKFVGRVLF
jgi:hypothetical protein